MSLTGLDPNTPVPGTYVELTLGAGATAGQAIDRTILIYANKTTAGSETTATIGDPVIDEADCIARCGRRSEALWMYRMANSHDPDARIYLNLVAESGGTAATV